MEYQTDDMWLAAYLMNEGAKLERLVSGKGRRKTFVLSCAAAKLTEASRAYYQGTARVDPKALRHCLADLKGFMSSRAVTLTKRKERQNGASGSRNGELGNGKEDTGQSTEG